MRFFKLETLPSLQTRILTVIDWFGKMVYLNPGGFNFGPENLDGYGISNITFGVVYSLFFYGACIFLWFYRHHPVVKMRNVPLLLMSLLTLHVFLFMVLVVYTLNGAFPCQVEFWCMSLYLPIGIGLFQAQNQQLLVVSSQQAKLVTNDELFRSLPPKSGKGFGSFNYWVFRLKCWWRDVCSTRRYEAYVTLGIVIQVGAVHGFLTGQTCSRFIMSSLSDPSSSTTSLENLIITVSFPNTNLLDCVVEDGNGTSASAGECELFKG